MPEPVPQNGGYMIAAYVLVGVILVGYALSLYLRARRSLRAELGTRLGQTAVPVRNLRCPEIERFVRRPMIARIVERLGVVPQRRGAATCGVGAREARGRFGKAAGPLIERARGHRGIGALLER